MLSTLRTPRLPILGAAIRSRAVQGTGWTTLGFGLNYAVRLLSTLALTRLLAPEVFGLMSLATVIVMALNMLSDLGTNASIIRSPRGEEPTFLDTAWTIQVLRGFWIGGTVLCIAWPLSRLYDQPQLFPLLCALAAGPMMQGFSSVSIALCQRRVDLFRPMLLDLAVQVGSTLINILLAWWLQSVWALVAGTLFAAAARVLLSYLWLPAYRPHWRLEREARLEIVRFGRWILLGTLFTYFGGEGTKAVMGIVVPIETLGLIVIATTLAWAFGDLVGKVLGQVVFPTLSRVHRERPAELPAALAKVKALILFAVLPGFLLVSFLGPTIVGFLYDPRYAAAGDYVRLIALNGALSTLVMPYQNTLLVLGNSRAHSMVMGLDAAMRVGFLLLGAELGGVFGMITGMGIATLGTYSISLRLARQAGLTRLQYDALSLLLILAAYGHVWISIA